MFEGEYGSDLRVQGICFELVVASFFKDFTF
jgi:hypothetical protein